MDNERAEEIKLEAEYWREVLRILQEIDVHHGEMNGLLPTCVLDIKQILEVQKALLKAVQGMEVLSALIKGRTTHLRKRVEEL